MHCTPVLYFSKYSFRSSLHLSSSLKDSPMVLLTLLNNQFFALLYLYMNLSSFVDFCSDNYYLCLYIVSEFGFLLFWRPGGLSISYLLEFLLFLNNQNHYYFVSITCLVCLRGTSNILHSWGCSWCPILLLSCSRCWNNKHV